MVLSARPVGSSYAPVAHLLQAGGAIRHQLQLMSGGDPSEDTLQLPPEAPTQAISSMARDWQSTIRPKHPVDGYICLERSGWRDLSAVAVAAEILACVNIPSIRPHPPNGHSSPTQAQNLRPHHPPCKVCGAVLVFGAFNHETPSVLLAGGESRIDAVQLGLPVSTAKNRAGLHTVSPFRSTVATDRKVLSIKEAWAALMQPSAHQLRRDRPSRLSTHLLRNSTTPI